jgi:hypothetical protein
MRRGKRILFRLLLLLLSTAAVMLGLEIWLRVHGYEGESDRQLIHFSPMSPPRELPAAQWYFQWPTSSPPGSQVEVNGQSITLEKPEEEFRVLFLGDSATYGFGVKAAEAFPSQYQDLVQSTCPDAGILAINAGIQGINTVVELFMLQKLVALSPDVVVLGIFVKNDINTDLFSHRRLERYQHASGVLATLRGLRTRSALVHYLYLKLLALNNRVPLVERGGDWVQDALPVEFDSLTPEGLNLANYVEAEYALYQAEPAPLLAEAYVVLSSLLQQMRAICRTAGCTLVPLIIPTPAQVGGKLSPTHPGAASELEARGFSADVSSLDLEAPSRAILEICHELRLDCIDPTALLREMGPGEAFIQDDVHPSRKGHALLARRLLAETDAWAGAECRP